MIVDDPYKALGVRKAINAAGILTRIGGSRSPPKVFRAMEEASKSFVTISELQTAAGKVIADATGAKAGLPTAGGSTSILLAAAACIMKGTELEEYEPRGPAVWRKIAQRLPMRSEGLRTEFIVQKCNRDEYDHAVEIAGGRFVEAGTETDCSEEDLMNAFSENTAACYYTHKSPKKGLPLEKIVEIAHRKGVPVIVDAATIPPPRSGLTRFSEMGVDLACFSGGKTLAGPNNSGLLSGRADLVKLAHLQSYPFEGVGRPSKMSRETIVGLITALTLYLESDDNGGFAENTAACYYTHKSTKKGLPLEKIVEITHRNDLPVIVDAATIPPPRSGLTRFSEIGVDLTCFSGGKTLAGPNNSGLLSGRADLIKLAHLQSYPFEGVGRPSKMSRETIVGLITALTLYLESDDSRGFAEREETAFYISKSLDSIPGITSYVDYIGGESKTNPLTCVKADKYTYGSTTKELFDALIDGDPSIVTVYEPYFLLENYHGLFSVNPQFLSPEEVKIIISRIREEASS